MPVSLLFPWYGFKLGSPISATAIDSFNFAHAALLLTAAAVIFVLVRAQDRPLPRPLSVGGLLIAAGIWSGVILIYLFADRPTSWSTSRRSAASGSATAHSSPPAEPWRWRSAACARGQK